MRRVRKKIAKKYEILPVLPADNESQNSGKVETLMEVLAEVNISEAKYLRFGTIWREIAARDKLASCRKVDQFIFYSDLYDFVIRLDRSWKMGETKIEDVYNWDFPVMGLTTGLKVHRMDFTLACIRETGSIEFTTQEDIAIREGHLLQKSTDLGDQSRRNYIKRVQKHLFDRFPTRACMECYIVGSSREFNNQSERGNYAKLLELPEV
ncbi:Oidioi.mRNA.OKI2018_I69.PAR.g9571.t1.cds [Oikopleura dioica]|uniref:Oidioi.mRNA.OKI2018_I69.PAR.g9571.t1.cds n=1 Tax=Oikopleura dioica TaxID=34765 RepID=A0ABN7RRQ8_OIKDI|nr:Oidioi.mRNA.OKI2018_I69.PAR.g9571.t1.cds [Oikopleura dioica]